MTIKSENGSANCFVQAANPYDHAFNVTADYVNINGFTVKGANKRGKAGIYLYYVSNCNVSNNIVSNNNFGIQLTSSSSNALTNNIASSNGCGIDLYHSSNNNTLTNNIASNNKHGIFMSSSTNNTLTKNSMSDNNYNFGVYQEYI